MGSWSRLGHHNPRCQLVLLFQIPFRPHQWGPYSFALQSSFLFVPRPQLHPSNRSSRSVVFPIGKAWARNLPNVTFFGLSLNPGPFTIKEHVIITIMSGVGAVSAYAIRANLLK